jgi:kynureninase
MAPEFRPAPTAEGWQLSNPPVLAMAPVAASLEHFAAVGLPALRQKSVALTNYFERLVHARLGGRVRIITPANPAERGAALSLRLVGISRDRARAVFDGLRRRSVLPDWREPDVIRAAPVPFYNSFDDVWRCVDALHAELPA